MEYSAILARFEAVSDMPDGGFIARCPAHPDGKPSLRIWFDDSAKARITCRAGCEPGDVITAAGLRWADLFDITGDMPTVKTEPPSMATPAHTAALAAYIDRTVDAMADDSWFADVATAYAADRFGLSPAMARDLYIGVDDGSDDMPYLSRTYRAYPRLTVPLHDFDGIPRGLQGRDVSGDCPTRWVSLSNPRDHRWSPYGYFKGSDDYTIVTEGPGDGLTVAGLGYSAVVVRGATLASNADLIREIAEGVKGSQVIVAGDRDDAGQRFIKRLATGLDKHGIDTYTVDIPQQGWDLTDWRENDSANFPAEFRRAVRSAKRVELTPTLSPDVATPSAKATDAADALNAARKQFGKSDVSHAHALVTWADGGIRYAEGLGYLVWNGRLWERDADLVRAMIHRMGAALILQGMGEDAYYFTVTKLIDAILKELKGVPGVKIAADGFDARPDLLNFRNGTVNLRTGELREFSKEDLLTFALDIDYRPDAEAPRFQRLLGELFPEHPELPEYMRRLIGYGITGHTSEQCFAVFHGKGANGKSVFLDAIGRIFSAATKRTRFQTFEEKANGAIPNDIAALRDARLVLASEGKAGKPMDEATLKSVTGDDTIQARFMRQEFFTFQPKFLILLGTNHKPRFTGQDEGIWRRVKLIPFTRYFAPHEREDKAKLDRTLQKDEAEGIAAWAVRGAMEWYTDGLRDPDSIKDATAEYRETSDALSGFFPGVLVHGEESETILGSQAFNDYLDWCEAENLPDRERWTRRAFYSAMEERGVTRKRHKAGITLVGIRKGTESDHAAGPGIFAG